MIYDLFIIIMLLLYTIYIINHMIYTKHSVVLFRYNQINNNNNYTQLIINSAK